MMIFRTAEDLIDQFPWLNPREDWSNDYVEFDDGEYWTELDDLPEGWKEGFLEEMLYEIDEVLNEYDCIETYRVIEAKNHHGELKWSHGGYPLEAKEEIEAIIKVYKKASLETCMVCGRVGKAYMVDGEIIVACDLHKPSEDDIDVLL
jgi:hypothetical protein